MTRLDIRLWQSISLIKSDANVSRNYILSTLQNPLLGGVKVEAV